MERMIDRRKMADESILKNMSATDAGARSTCYRKDRQPVRFENWYKPCGRVVVTGSLDGGCCRKYRLVLDVGEVVLGRW